VRARPGIGIEIGWLVAFLVIFTAIAFTLLKFVVPHHFNDRVAIMLAAIVAGLVWTGLRAAAFRRQ
jgi:uncharacterized BrkB/YihY/UPF0761 family membrane protein